MPAKQATENTNAFKLWINRGVLVKLAAEIGAVFPDFDQKRLIALSPKLDPLELKQRVRLIRDRLREQLPQDYLTALKILVESTQSRKLSGFALWPYTEFIQTYGLDHPNQSLAALCEVTELFTGEFAVRPYLKSETSSTLAFLSKCTKSKNTHVRRWASEGSRPRLPWGERLDVFIKNPYLTLPILENLKYDDELYVRKSVANHLNDITKDHPALVVKILKRWTNEARDEQIDKIRWIAHRSLRSLIKQGDARALAVIGVSTNAQIKVTDFSIGKKKFKVGDRIEIEFALHSLATKRQRIVVDYIVHFMKSNGAMAPKVFKLKTLELAPRAILKIEKRHHLKLISTRRFYPGAHAIEIQVNGIVVGRTEFSLL
jgi:3-methyladenine DNA glycosylase AlkC